MWEEPDSTQRLSCAQPPMAPDAKRQLLEFLQEQAAPLLSTLRSYVQRFGLATGDAARSAALEVLQEVVVEALAHAERFDTARQPMAWLLGVAVNVIKRKKGAQARQAGHELPLSQLSTKYPQATSESDVLDLLTSSTIAGPEQVVEAEEQARALLALVSAHDQQVLRLALLEDFQREELAQRLGTTTGAAAMRLHRAISRLRSAVREQQELRQKGEEYE